MMFSESKIKYHSIINENKTDKPIVIYTEGLDFNRDYCINNDIKMINANHIGGCIIEFPGDIAVGLFSEGPNPLNRYIEHVLNWLKEKIPNADIVYTGNDITINGNKVLGASHKIICGYNYICMFLGYCPDIDVIRNISNKEMVKEPIGLKDFGITKEEVLQEIKDISML